MNWRTKERLWAVAEWVVKLIPLWAFATIVYQLHAILEAINER